MKIKILGKGKIGNAIHKLTNWEFIDKKNLKEINDSVIFNCTPASSLPIISKFKPKYVINCCKGMINNKTATDYFKKNISSIGGYYTPKTLHKYPTLYISKIPKKIKKEIMPFFILIEVKETSKQIEMSGVIKNLLLIYNEKIHIDSFMSDFMGCNIYGSRNQKFSKLFFRFGYNIETIKKRLGLLEGLQIAPQILKKRLIKW